MKARISTIVVAAFLALGACKPEVGPIGPSYEAGAGILGSSNSFTFGPVVR